MDLFYNKLEGYLSAQAVYVLHSTMPSVTCLRLSDVSVICRVTYLQFPIHACFFFHVSQPGSTAAYLVYPISDIRCCQNLGRFLVHSIQPRGMILN